jgi:L-threonylcarbamoyladenylate synthase
VAAPSANRFGRVSPTTAQHVREDLGDDVDLVLDGGPTRVGVESTIVDCTRGGGRVAVLRVGAVTVADVERITGARVELATGGEVAAPGTLATHYAPRARVELHDAGAIEGRARDLAAGGARVGVLALAAVPAVRAGADVPVVVLDPPRDVDDYAHVLYQRLRDADARGVDVLLVVPPPEEGLGVAVRDRLRRAAAGYRLS